MRHPLLPPQVTPYLVGVFLCFQAALLARAQTVPQPLPEVRALLDQGKAAEEQAKSEAAASLYRQALQLARDRKDRAGEATALIGLGRAVIYEKPLESIASFEQALPVYRDLQDKPGQATCFLL